MWNSRREKVVVAAACVVVLAAVVITFIPPSEAPFRQYVAQLRAAGRKTSEAEFLAPEPDPSDNAADAVMESTATESAAHAAGVGLWRDGAEATPAWYETATPEDLLELGAYLDTIEPFFVRLDAASQRRFMQLPLPTGLIAVDPLTPGLQAAQRLLYARSLTGTSAVKRVRAIETAMRVSLLCRGNMIQRMVGSAVMVAATGTLRRELERGEVSAAALRRRFDPMLVASRLPSFPDVVHVELATQVRIFEGLLDGATFDDAGTRMAYQPGQNLVGRTVLGIYGNRGTVVGSPADWVNACRFVDELAALDTRSYPTLRRAVVSRIDDLPQFSAARTSGIVFPRIAEMFARTDAATRLTRIALAAAEHRATHGDFPASLDELKPMFPGGVPLDPFTDAPFVYAKTATGVRIASVGRLPEDAPLDEATLRERCLVWELRR